MRSGMRLGLLVAGVGLIAGCSSSGGGGSSTAASTSYYYGQSWYGNPNYWYDDPDYIVVAPPGRPGEPPIESGNRPTQLPAEVDGPGPRPAPTTTRSRMPAAEPRMSSPRTQPSISRGARGGGGRMRR